MIVILSLLITACDFFEDPSKPTLNLTPEIQKKLAAFQKQEHRFEFSGCSLSYNNNPINLKMSATELVEIFGKHNESKDVYGEEQLYLWFGGILKAYENNQTKTLSAITIAFSKMQELDNSFHILIEGAPLNDQILMGDFVKSSIFDFSDFYIGNSSYELVFNECSKPISYHFISEVQFNYIGNGHARLKDRPKLEQTEKVTALEISYYDE